MLRAAGWDFTVRTADIDETPRALETPRAYVLRLAEEKARAIEAAGDETVLAADTTVVVGGEIIGKPDDAADATRMLRALSGRSHEVLTGVCLRRGAKMLCEEMLCDAASTTVWFSRLSDEEIRVYAWLQESRWIRPAPMRSRDWLSRFIERIDGSYSNVVGLPVALVYRMLSSPASTGLSWAGVS